MLYTIAVVLLVLWAVGYFGFPAMLGNLVHILLVIAVIVVLVRIIQGKKPIK